MEGPGGLLPHRRHHRLRCPLSARSRARGRPLLPLRGAHRAALAVARSPSRCRAYRRLYREQGWDQCRCGGFNGSRRLGVVPAAWPLSPRPAAVGDWAADPYQDWQAERMAVYAAQVAADRRGPRADSPGCRRSGADGQHAGDVPFRQRRRARRRNWRPATGFGFNPNTQNTPWRMDDVPIRPGSGPANLPGSHDTFAAYGLAWAAVSNTPLRSTKLTAYEGGIRTPLVVRWPAVIREGGRLTDQVGHVMDLMATCLDVAGAPSSATSADASRCRWKAKACSPSFKADDEQDTRLMLERSPRPRHPHGTLEARQAAHQRDLATLRPRSRRGGNG